MVNMMNVRKNSAQFIFVFLGMLTAFGPFVTDMYLPSLPSMQVFFNTSVSMVQMGLTFSMLGLAFGQLIFGPLSDKCGRREPLIISMFLLTSCWQISMAYNKIPFKMLKRIYGEEHMLRQLSVNKCPKKGHEKTIPISSQTLVKLADTFEGNGLYAIGFIIINKKIKSPKHSCMEVIFRLIS